MCSIVSGEKALIQPNIAKEDVSNGRNFRENLLVGFLLVKKMKQKRLRYIVILF
jgi:hypothetical protein